MKAQLKFVKLCSWEKKNYTFYLRFQESKLIFLRKMKYQYFNKLMLYNFYKSIHYTISLAFSGHREQI